MTVLVHSAPAMKEFAPNSVEKVRRYCRRAFRKTHLNLKHLQTYNKDPLSNSAPIHQATVIVVTSVSEKSIVLVASSRKC